MSLPNSSDESRSFARGDLRNWWLGARPRTWGAAFAPVIAGSAVAAHAGAFDFALASLALAVALALQIGVNYANDYSDGIRGTDQNRIGPVRLVGQGLAKPSSVKAAAWLAFLVGAIAGLALSVLSGQLWLLVVGGVAIAAAWFYTGGSRPYGYLGLGEVMAFLFFGPIAVLGTSYTQSGQVSVIAIWAGVAIGLFASALLLVNNIRDISTDKRSGKHTIAVKLGQRRAVGLYVLILALAFGCLLPIAIDSSLGVFIALLALIPALRASAGLLKPRALPLTSVSELVYAVGLALGLTILA